VLLLKNPAARWFHDTLLDADLAVNSMVWFMCFV
jgi:deoxyribodipyrimidine photolyase